MTQQAWQNHYSLVQKLFSDPLGLAQQTQQVPFPWLFPDPLNFAPLEPLTKEGDKLRSQPMPSKKIIMDYQPRGYANSSAPQ